MKLRILLGCAVAATALALASRNRAPSAPPAATAEAPVVAALPADAPSAVPSAAAMGDTELGRLHVPLAAAPRAKAPTTDEWEAHGQPVALPHASRCLAAALDGWLRLECESRRGAGFGVAVLAGSRAGVSIEPSTRGVTRVVFPVRQGDRRFFQLDEVQVIETGRGYEGDGRDTEVVPAVNVSVVWLENEAAPRIVIRDA